jgi:integrase/recombinase XerD
MSSKVNQEQQTFLGEDYIEIWINSFLQSKRAENLVKGTIEYYKDNLLPFAKYLETQEIKFISQITPDNIRDFLLILEDKGHNSGGIHGYFRAIKSFLRWYEFEVEPDGWKNPIHKVKAPKNPVEPIEGIKKEDFDSLVSACEKGKYYGERDKTILFVLLDTGVRASELCSINLEDINFPDSSILIRQGKGRKPRYVFFGKSTRRQLRKWLTFRGNEGHSLFINRYGERIVYGTLREIMRRLSLKAGIQEPGLHDFRRGFCLECLRNGMSEITIARIMGHTTTQLIGRYAKQTTVDLMNSYKSVLDD